MVNNSKSSKKGQSAIEYLSTYGWALLAIVIVGAVLVQMGVFSQCNKTTPRFAGSEAAIDTWAFTGTNQLNFVVEAINRDLQNVGVSIDIDGDGNYEHQSAATSDISAGQTTEITVDTGTSFTAGECASATVALNYTISGISGNTISTGSGKLGGRVP